MIAMIAMTRAYLTDWLGADLDREEGQGMVEYTLIIGTISLVIVAAFLTTGISSAIGNLAASIATAISASP
jgi:Flp pilus assembly pilin Flp